MALKKKKTTRQNITDDFEKRSLPKKENNITQEEPMDNMSIRLQESIKKDLQVYFRRDGLKLTQGLRMIIMQFYNEKIR